MNLPYIIQTQLCLSLFWIIYQLFMRKSGAFSHNRFYLLGIVVLSFVIPALSIPVWTAPASVFIDTTMADFDEFLFLEAEETALPNTGINWMKIALWISTTGVLIMSIGVLRHIFRMTRSIQQQDTPYLLGKVRLVYSRDIKSPYSFFHYIFVNESSKQEHELAQIVAHEMAHIRLRHSYDSIFSQAVLILFWWNPFVWLWSRSLKEVHEFQADQAVLQQGFDSKQYITLLIGTIAGIHPEFVSGFSYSLIKNRLLMMTKTTSRFSKLRILIALPALAGALLLFSFTAKPIPVNDTETFSEELTETVPPDNDDEPFIVVEEMPKFQDGDVNTFRNWLQYNISYPAKAADEKIAGRVVTTFIVEKDGSVSNIRVIKSPHALLSDEAVRAISSSPKWAPGKQRGETVRVSFAIPVDFNIPGVEHSSVPAQSPNGNLAEFKKWIQKHIVYPSEAVEKNIQGRVVVRFDVSEDGTVYNARPANEADPLLVAEAVRVVSSSPKWTPAKESGKSVATSSIVSVDFQLHNGDERNISSKESLAGAIRVVGYSPIQKTYTVFVKKGSDNNYSIERSNSYASALESGVVNVMVDDSDAPNDLLNRVESEAKTGGAEKVFFFVRGQSSSEKSGDPVIYVNGKIYHGGIHDLTPDSVESITVIKNDPNHPTGRIDIYLKEAKN